MKYQALIPILIAAALALPSCNKAPAPAAEAPSATPKTPTGEVAISQEQQRTAKIETQPAQATQEPEMLHVRGRMALADDRTVRVGVRTQGSVIAVYAGLGDYVHKGQILARYHADEVRDSRAQYRGALAELERAKTAAAQAQRQRDRMQRLLDLRAASVQQVEIAQQDVLNAQAIVKKAQIEVDRGKDLLEDDLKVPADPPANRTDETEDEVPILAPADGFILEKNVTPGKSVELSSVTFVLGDISKIWMLASVRQEDLGKLREGQSASVTLNGDTGHRYPGKITNLGQEFDAATRVMQVRIEVNNPGNRLRPEMLANADIPIGRGKPAVVVPADSVQQVNGQDVVFVQTAPDRFTVRTVHTGETADGKTPILEGLNAGEPVAIRGSFVLKSLLLKATLESE